MIQSLRLSRFSKSVATLCFVGGALMMGSSAVVNAKTIKIANYYAENHPQNIALREEFVPYIKEHTGMDVEIYPNSALGAARQFTNGVRTGSIEMVIAGLELQQADPKIGFPEMPFLFADYKQADSLLNGPLGKLIEPSFERLGTVTLGWTANGFRDVSSNREITKMDDFKGLKLRMPNITLYVDLGTALGLSVQTMEISEVYTALEQKVVDGQDNPIQTLYNSGWYEVQSNVLQSHHMFSPAVYLMNKKFYQNLTEAEQQAVREASKRAMAREWELMENSDEKVKDALVAAGLTITTPSPEFRKAMQDAASPIYDKYTKKFPWMQEMLDIVRNDKT